jgi:amidase
MNTAFTQATEIVRLIAAREVSATEIAEASLERIARLNPPIGAYVTVTAEGALAQAKAVDARIAAGEDPGLLGGVPLSIKDLTPVEGVRMTLGSRLFADFMAPFDAFFVSKLRAAGAVFLGKTNTSEVGAAPLTDNDLFGPTRNPWDLERNAGGSSGGAAAAVACGLGPIAEGSDGGGSIRIPSSCCGVVGLKPSRGRVSAAPAMGEPWGGMATTGTLARTVLDAALLLDVMAGPATGDPYWAPPPASPFRVAARTEPARLRIAFATGVPGVTTDPEVVRIVEDTAALLEKLGHTLEQGCPSFAGMAEQQFTIACTGIASAMADLVGDEETMTPFVRAMKRNGDSKTGIDYARAVREMHRLSRDVVGFFDDYDVLLTPTLTRPAPAVDWFPAPAEAAHEEFYRWLAFTYPFNMTGQPAISVPGGWTAAGLPVGVQLVGRPASEGTIISLAAQLERAAPWRDRVPPAAVEG